MNARLARGDAQHDSVAQSFDRSNVAEHASGKSRLLRFSGLMTVLTLGTLLIAPSYAAAQEAEEAEGEIVVTGTRISGFTAPTPVTTVGAEQLQDGAIRNLSEVMFEIPTLRPVKNVGQTSQPVGAANLDLHSLGPNRTLLLLDGRRFAPTDTIGGVDLNIIPTPLINRIEIVTGGASAAYGSDAVSGVANIFLDHSFEGFKGDIQYGQSSYDDHHSPGMSLTAGHAFLGGRLHVVASGEYFSNDGQLAQSSREWGDDNIAVLAVPSGTPGPRQITVANARFLDRSFGGATRFGTTTPAPLRGIQFGPGGTVLPFTYGANAVAGSVFAIGGDGDVIGPDANITPQIERQSFFGRATYEVSDSISVYADALLAQSNILSDGAMATFNLNIKNDNAFLPAAVRTIMTNNGITNFNMSRLDGENGYWTADIETTVERYGAGVNGNFGDSWTWDAFVQYSRTNYHRDNLNNSVSVGANSRVTLGADAVINPATGQPICRARLTNPNPTDAQDPFRNIRDCVPINFFGDGSVTDEMLAYYSGTSWLDSEQTQELYAANIAGSPFNTWAGPVSMAAGGEHRRDSIDARSDAISRASGWATINDKPVSGEVDVTEGYVEAVVPLLTDVPLARNLDINGAVRVTDYSTSGEVTTWKAGVNYTPFSDLRLRATRSRDIRAANINELFSGQSQFVNTITNPITNFSASTQQLTGGNPNLTPESADTITAGFVYQPSWLPGLRLSVDWYSIEISDAISTLSGQQIVDGCLIRGQTNLCPAITFTGGVITLVEATLINAAESTAEGVDLEAAYRFELGGWDVDVRALATRLSELTLTDNGVTTNFVTQVGQTSAFGPASGGPEWRSNYSINFSRDAFRFGGKIRYVGGGVQRVTWIEGIDIDENDVDSRTYFDLHGSYEINEHLQLYTAIDNVFNEAPPATPNAIQQPQYSASAYYDTIGRFVTVGARFNF
jgi:outer membrane receptor protein involved in Fe transport